MRYRVSLLQPDMETAYSEFWERLSAGQESVLAYHHLAYRDLLQACLGPDASPRYWIVQDQHGDRAKDYPIVEALPCFVKQSNVGPTYCSLPFFGPNAGVLCSYSEPDAPLWHRLLLKAAMAEAIAAGAWSITFYTPLWFADFSWYEEVLAPDFLVVQKFTQHMPSLPRPNGPAQDGAIYDVRKAPGYKWSPLPHASKLNNSGRCIFKIVKSTKFRPSPTLTLKRS